jgi:hypothetical protein
MSKHQRLRQKYQLKQMQHLSAVVVAHALKWPPMRQPPLQMKRTKIEI